MRKIVIFDWGGIVESHENNFKDLKEVKIRTLRRYNKVLSDEELLACWTDRNKDGQKMGSINDSKEIENWLGTIEENANINIMTAELISAYEEEGRHVKYYKDVVDFAHSLKNKCQIAILSNLLPIDKKRIDDQYNLSVFDHVYLSFEVGLRKPDPKIYEYVLKDLGVTGSDILFIDDDSENIHEAQQQGWNTCEAFGYELDKIKEAVLEFLSNK